jgi:carbon-monoxide dehydrogenase medium subunit
VEVVSGCTNTIVDARAGRKSPGAVIDLSRVADLRFARRDNGSVVVGGGTTLTDCEQSPLLQAEAPLLGKMAADFAGPLVRNRATLAGNLAYASPAADAVPPLLALDASLTLVSRARGARTLPLADFILGPRRTSLAPDELITDLSFPAGGPPVKSAYFKFALRNAMAISLVSGAVTLRLEGGVIAWVRLALGAVAPRPYRVTAAEALLAGQAPGDELLREAARIAADSTAPIDDIRASAAYRREMTAVMTRRMLERALAA